MREGLVEVDQIFQAEQQDLAQADPTHSEVELRRVRPLIGGSGKEADLSQLLSDDTKAIARTVRGGSIDLEEIGGQTRMQRQVALRLNVDAIALQAVTGGAFPLIDRDTDARLLQALSQTEAAEATADNQDMQRR